jgi:hypothetical protein
MANQDQTPVVVAKSNATRKYKVIGLKEQESMPIEHKGLMYDLANLSDEQLKVLVDTKCPYVER